MPLSSLRQVGVIRCPHCQYVYGYEVTLPGGVKALKTNDGLLVAVLDLFACSCGAPFHWHTRTAAIERYVELAEKETL